MQNVEMSVDKNILTITVDISKRYDKSKSGKTTIIASTGGNVFIPDSTTVKIGLNIYEK
jgi:hypothetical protein